MTTYAQQIHFNSSAVVTLRWPDFKAICTAKNLSVQYITQVDSYCVFAFDDDIAYKCLLVFSSVSPTFQFDSDYSQAQNDTDTTDFLTNYHTSSNQTVAPRLADGRIRVASEKTSVVRATLYSHDWTDPTTWYGSSVLITAETATDDGTHLNYATSKQTLIDSYHGKLTGEDYLVDSNNQSYRVSVYVNGTQKTEQDPHYGTGGDYTIDYKNGIIHFLAANQPTDVVTVTYHYMVDSSFIIKPNSGTNLSIDSAEVQFTTDIGITDTTTFQLYGIVDFFAPELVTSGAVPTGTVIPLGNSLNYKTMNDYQNDAQLSYPTYPALGGSSWRGLNTPHVILSWNYQSALVIESASGMYVKIKLQHDVPFTGTAAAATFYCIVETE
jgi:hypothetical protein